LEGINGAARDGRAIARPVRFLPRTETLPLHPHLLENVGKGPIDLILVELKGKSAEKE